MRLSPAGTVADEVWRNLPIHFAFLVADEFVVMPDHIHGLLCLDHGRLEQPTNTPKPDAGTTRGSVGAIVQNFKSIVSRMLRVHNPEIMAVWQRNYYERVIRNDNELHAVRTYIVNNPLQWSIGRNDDNGP